MGSLPGLEPRHRFDLPVTPPELASPGASSSSSRSSPSTERAWGNRDQASNPMSNYDKSLATEASTAAGKGVRDNKADSVGHNTSRQQLPSLHSLFGPPSSIRPPNFSDRESSYPARSPLDRPRISPGVPGFQNSSSYFPRIRSPVSQQRSTYEPRLDQDRQTPLSTSSAFIGSRSPKAYDLGRFSSHGESEASKWSFHNETSRQEYSLGSRDTFRAPDATPRPQFAGSASSPRHYSRQTSRQTAPNTPPTPDGSAVSEGLPSKDGLGPKIWTGTHFLPRFVRAGEVPGEGMCYFYDDGSHCKTVIDGEAVNAHWGVTKAGKPRKRLAIACITCREKKIKCDPDYPRCVQCEKFGRICKFKNAPRGGHNTSPSTPPAELEDLRRSGVTSDPEMKYANAEPLSPRSPRLPQHQESSRSVYVNKRLRVGSDTYVSNRESSISQDSDMNHFKSTYPRQSNTSPMPQISDDILQRAWRTDPYVTDPQSISTVLSQFFGQIDNTIIIRFLPEDLFKSWVASSAHRKSPDDLMLLYSVLAVGVALSGGSKSIAFEYSQVAHFAQKQTTAATLQLVQSRILLALYHVIVSRFWEANELLSSATATSSCLQLSQEIERSKDASLSLFPFDMTRAGYAEARRRTLWSLFMLERLAPMFPNRATMINPEDIYIRLPADTESFEKQLDTLTPIFNPYDSTLATLGARPSDITSHLVEMVHMWSSCQATIHRIASRPHGSDAEGLKVRSLIKRVHDWHASLPSRLSFGASNLESAAFSGKVGSFLTMHLLCHHALIQLNRYHLSVGNLSEDYKTNYARECRDNASAIIDVISCLERILRTRPTILSTPPPAVAISAATAVDVLASSGDVSTLDEVIESARLAKTAVDGTANIWAFVQGSQSAIADCLQTMYSIGDHRSGPLSSASYQIVESAGTAKASAPGLQWRKMQRIDQAYPADMDVLYCHSN